MVAESTLVVSSPADSVTPPEDKPDSLMCSLVGSTLVAGVTSATSSNVIVNTPVPSFSADEENAICVVSEMTTTALSAASLIVFGVDAMSCTAAASMSSCGSVSAMTARRFDSVKVNEMVTESALEVSSPADSVTPPEDEPDSLMTFQKSL